MKILLLKHKSCRKDLCFFYFTNKVCKVFAGELTKAAAECSNVQLKQTCAKFQKLA